LFSESVEGPPLLPDETDNAWPDISKLYKELRVMIVDIWEMRRSIMGVAKFTHSLYLDEGLPNQAAFSISVVRHDRVIRKKILVEPLTRAKKCCEKLEMYTDIAKAYCEMELDEEVGGEMIRLLEEELYDSSLVKLFK
jgi:hypothetical protein